jgi:hypothetical protein
MPLSEEGARRFGAYTAQTDPSNLNPSADSALFDFVGWALVHEPEALSEPFAYERLMSERDFSWYKVAYVQTVVFVAQPLLLAYERERAG